MKNDKTCCNVNFELVMLDLPNNYEATSVFLGFIFKWFKLLLNGNKEKCFA